MKNFLIGILLLVLILSVPVHAASGSVPCFVIVYDSTSATGNQIAAVDCAGKGQLTYDVSFTAGLTIVTTSTATPASAPDVTAIYQ